MCQLARLVRQHKRCLVVDNFPTSNVLQPLHQKTFENNLAKGANFPFGAMFSTLFNTYTLIYRYVSYLCAYDFNVACCISVVRGKGLRMSDWFFAFSPAKFVGTPGDWCSRAMDRARFKTRGRSHLGCLSEKKSSIIGESSNN